MAADAHRDDRLRKGGRTTKLDDMINTSPTGPSPHGLTPLRLSPVIDGVIGTQKIAVTVLYGLTCPNVQKTREH